jgi:hypothetical protein
MLPSPAAYAGDMNPAIAMLVITASIDFFIFDSFVNVI